MDFRENTEILFKSLPDSETKKSYREIPASTKPLLSTLKWIFEYHSTEISVEAKKILETDITQTDIKYLTDENRYLPYTFLLCRMKCYKIISF